jgi:N-acetylglucosaminyl-diphospho-decaprenol L-rhamnosyltransferase
MTRVAVVIVTYNSADVLAGCLRSLSEGAAGVTITDVVVADNASADETVRIAKENDAQIVQLGRNAGYAAGFNAGVTALAGREPDAVLLINPDCRMSPGSIATLAEALKNGKRGIVAPRLLNPDGTLQPTLRRMPTVRGAWVEALVGGTRADRMGIGELVFGEAEHARPGAWAWATGAALLISWPALTELGPWDESFLLYSEETEFIFRAADHGWTLWYEPAAVVEHIGGESGTHPGLAALVIVNKVGLFRRRHNRIAAGAYHLGVLLGEALRALAGRAISRAAVAALLRPSRRISSLDELT